MTTQPSEEKEQSRARRLWNAIVEADRSWSGDRRTFPLFRWVIGVVMLVTTLPGAHGVATWWDVHAAVIVVAAVLVFGPDLARLEFGGVKMELLRETKADLREHRTELREVRAQLSSVQSQISSQKMTLQQVFTQAAKEDVGATLHEVRDVMDTGEDQRARRGTAIDVMKFMSAQPAFLYRRQQGPVPEPSPAPDAESTVGE